ncbi:MAG: cell wall-binding repeat-containing protein, partial [Coriobacteriia bacterium]|nr:cell wall-binding repeat-containing protein [Coriobacteriia bacterium]
EGVAAEIARLGARRVLVVGGPGAVGRAVDDALRSSLPGIVVERGFAGADRYETAALLAARTLSERASSPEPGMVFVVRGDAFADALAVAPIAYSARIPILLTRPTSVPAPTIDAIAAGGFDRAVVVGGTGAVPHALLPALKIPSKRVSGPDRYATAAEFARWAFIGNLTHFSEVGLATGATFPDALGGGAALGSRGGVLLLTPPTTLAEPTRRALADYAHRVERITVFGGTSAVSADVRVKADAALW